MKLREIMSHEVKTVTPELLLTKVAERMKENDIGCMPVVKDGRLEGIITDRDIVVRALGAGKDPAASTAGDIMTEQVACLTEEQELTDAVHLMEEKEIRRVCILDDAGKLVGMVTLGDLAARAHDIAETGEVLERICAPELIA